MNAECILLAAQAVGARRCPAPAGQRARWHVHLPGCPPDPGAGCVAMPGVALRVCQLRPVGDVSGAQRRRAAGAAADGASR